MTMKRTIQISTLGLIGVFAIGVAHAASQSALITEVVVEPASNKVHLHFDQDVGLTGCIDNQAVFGGDGTEDGGTKLLASLAYGAMLSGKRVTIEANACDYDGAPIIDRMGISR
ncbi:MAG: hypothetical protein CL540_05565 [Alcanivorax sp.]|nr:hypothetical protein [Alcanivorax sp.]|tara:strand:+ start:688 stop:1029 length:342 start_codon:yes stop_codon:yes gene_type:complete